MLGVYPGSFNPIHSGHLDILKRSLDYFDIVTLLIADNPSKQYSLSSAERAKVAKQMIDKLGLMTQCFSVKVDILPPNKLLKDWCLEHESYTIIKGLRNGTDLDSEMTQEWYTKNLCPDLETIYFTTDNNKRYLSSTGIKHLACMKENDFIAYMKKVNRIDGLSDAEMEEYLKWVHQSFHKE